MNLHTLRNRLDALVGESEAQELWEAPNASLQGRTPQELIDQGNLRPVEILIRDMEARERTRRDFINLPKHEVDDIDDAASDPLIDRIPQRRHSGGSGRLFRILDQLDQNSHRRPIN